MTYPKTLEYLYTQLPMFTRVGSSAFKNNLTNTIALCNLLDNPQHKFKSVHVGGTNGKGSTSHMLAAILQTAGYKTGLYTSPHLKDFRERIRINGQIISEACVVDFVENYRKDFETIQPSFFEMTVALAFDIFAREKVDIAVIEVGLGGRLDSTNVITPLLSVITNIGWDHMNLLGDTLPLIATEKAGIIKENIPVIIGEYQPEVADIFVQKAKEQGAPIIFASEIFDVDSEVKGERLKANENTEVKGERLKVKGNAEVKGGRLRYKGIPSELLALTARRFSSANLASTSRLSPFAFRLDLTGTYQVKNVKTVLAAVDELRAQGYQVSHEHVKTALSHVKTLTGLRGRWDVLSYNPLVICDTGHNPEGIAEVMKNIAAVDYKHLHFVIGMVNDKDHSKVLSMLPKNAIYYFCRPDIPRGEVAESLKLKAESFGLFGQAYGNVAEAFEAAKTAATPDDLVFVGGSTFVVAEVV